MNGEKNSKDKGFELEDFWGISNANMQSSKNNAEDDDWSFDDLFAAKEKQDTAKLEEQRLEQERAAAREATRRQIEAEFAAKKKAEEEAKAAEAKAAADAAAAEEKAIRDEFYANVREQSTLLREIRDNLKK